MVQQPGLLPFPVRLDQLKQTPTTGGAYARRADCTENTTEVQGLTVYLRERTREGL